MEKINNYSHSFHESFIYAKGGVFLFLLLITVIYNILNGKDKDLTGWFSATYLFNPKWLWRPILDGGITGIFGVLAIIFVNVFRGKPFTLHTLFICLIAWIILAGFAVAQEASGFNRWSSQKEIKEGTSNYNQVWTNANLYERANKILTDDECKKLGQLLVSGGSPENINKYVEFTKDKQGLDATTCLNIQQLEAGGDPFIRNLGYASAIIVAIVVLILIGKMFIATYQGFVSGDNDISKAHFSLFPDASTGTKRVLFGVETLFITGLLSSFGPLIAPYIRKEPINKSSFGMAGFFFVVGSILNIMIQYTGGNN